MSSEFLASAALGHTRRPTWRGCDEAATLLLGRELERDRQHVPGTQKEPPLLDNLMKPAAVRSYVSRFAVLVNQPQATGPRIDRSTFRAIRMVRAIRLIFSSPVKHRLETGAFLGWQYRATSSMITTMRRAHLTPRLEHN